MNIYEDKGLFECGATVVSGISYKYEPKQALLQILNQSKQKWAFYVMCDAQPKNAKGTTGELLTAYVKEHNLGPMLESEGWHFNECHGPRYIKVYVWRPDYEGKDFKKWTDANMPKAPVKSMLEVPNA